MSESSGLKCDQGKPGMQLLDPLALEGLARVLDFGAKKYSAHNWRGGLSFTRIIGAVLRHTFALLRGEDTDSESGLPHADHLMCNAMFLSNMMKTRPDLDDRWKNPNVADTLAVQSKLHELRARHDAAILAIEIDVLRDSTSKREHSVDGHK